VRTEVGVRSLMHRTSHLAGNDVCRQTWVRCLLHVHGLVVVHVLLPVGPGAEGDCGEDRVLLDGGRSDEGGQLRVGLWLDEQRRGRLLLRLLGMVRLVSGKARSAFLLILAAPHLAITVTTSKSIEATAEDAWSRLRRMWGALRDHRGLARLCRGSLLLQQSMTGIAGQDGLAISYL
jgi:hypothetical protein